MQYLIDNKVPPKNKYDISLQDIIKNNDKAILDSAFETIKQNYKCPKGTVDDSNKCDIEKPIVNIPIPNKFKDIDNVKSDKIRGESSEFLNQLVQNNEYLVNSLKSYTNIGHLEVNKYLGNRISGNIPKETEKIIIGLDSIFNLQKEQNFLTSSSITTYRGVSDIEIENLLGLNQKHIYDIEPGKIITDPKFVSTTLNKEQALQFGRDRYGGSIITILIPKNSEALHTESVSGSEDELLINRNQSYKFLGVNKNIDNSGLDSNKPVHEFIFELVNANQKQSSSHLSDAVETIKLNYNCPDSEKNGTGPGSCGGNTNSKINRNPEIAPADYNSFFENFNKISKDKSEPDRVMRRLNAETVQRRFYRKTEEHFNEIKPENDKKLKENGEKLWDNLKPEVQSAIKSYTTQDYGVINSALQDDITREEVSLIKEATSKPLGVSTILYRGINFKMPKDIFKVGATWIHKPFASCSTGSFIAEEAASGKLTHITPEEKTILQIFTEPETKGFAVGKNSFYAGADAGSEVILDAGTKFQTIHSEKRGGMRILTVRAINDKQKQDSSYLEDVTNFIKLNYKCKAGTVDDSNKCEIEQDIKEAKFDNFKYEMDSFHQIYAQIADSKLIKYNKNISKYSEDTRLSGMRLIHRTGDNNHQEKARKQIEKEITNNTELGKYLNEKIISETKAFEENPVRLYRSGKYKNSIIESYTTNPDGAFTSNFEDVPPGNDFYKDYDELKKDGWKVLNGVLQAARYPEEYEVTLINTNELYKNHKNQKQNSSYLANVFETIKLNYKCPKGTVDDTNACGLEGQTSKPSETFIGFKSDHDFSSPQDIEANKRIQASLDKAAEPLKKFKPEDRRILKQYSVNSYIDVNQYLNGTLEKEVDQDSSILRHVKEDVDALDKLFSEANLQEPLVTYRGLKDDIIVKNPELRDALDTPGSQIEFPCFSSTSALPFMANNFAVGYNGRLLELQLPTGTKALFIAEESGLPNEFEILVNRGTKFEVVETRHTDIIPPNNGSYVNRSTKRVKITTIKAIV